MEGKTCIHCNETFYFEKPKQFGGHLTNCKMNQSRIKRIEESKKRKIFNFLCSCGETYEVITTDYLVENKKYKKFCSRKCANSRIFTEETKDKIRNSLKKPDKIEECLECNKEFIKRKSTHTFCSLSCSTKFKNKTLGICYMGGKASVKSQSRRSKNEILFSQYCSEKYDILTNEQMFNGWDADVIIPSLKVAILWNGAWHYKEIGKNHSLKQTQNRDSIKIKEISKFGYTPYIIKDMGRYSKKFVEEQFIIFQNWIEISSGERI